MSFDGQGERRYDGDDDDDDDLRNPFGDGGGTKKALPSENPFGSGARRVEGDEGKPVQGSRRRSLFNEDI